MDLNSTLPPAFTALLVNPTAAVPAAAIADARALRDVFLNLPGASQSVTLDRADLSALLSALLGEGLYETPNWVPAAAYAARMSTRADNSDFD